MIAMLITNMSGLVFAGGAEKLGEMSAAEVLFKYGAFESEGLTLEQLTARDNRKVMRCDLVYLLVHMNGIWDVSSCYQLPSGYSDIDGHWAKNIIGYYKQWGLFDGDMYDEFSPDNYITKTEACLWLLNLLGYDSDLSRAIVDANALGIDVQAANESALTYLEVNELILKSLDVKCSYKDLTLGSSLSYYSPIGENHLETIVQNDTRSLTVTLSKEIKFADTVASNFVISEPGGINPRSVNAVFFVQGENNDVVTIELGASILSNKEYRISSPLSDNELTFFGLKNTAGTNVVDSTTLEVLFKYPIYQEDIEAYAFKLVNNENLAEEISIDGISILGGTNNTLLRFDLGQETSSVKRYDLVSPLSDGSSFIGQSSAANGFTARLAVDSKNLKIEFDNPLSDGDLVPDNFVLSTDKGMREKLDIESVSFLDGGDNRIVIITLTNNTDGERLYWLRTTLATNSSLITGMTPPDPGEGEVPVVDNGISSVVAVSSKEFQVTFQNPLAIGDLVVGNFSVSQWDAIAVESVAFVTEADNRTVLLTLSDYTYGSGEYLIKTPLANNAIVFNGRDRDPVGNTMTGVAIENPGKLMVTFDKALGAEELIVGNFRLTNDLRINGVAFVEGSENKIIVLNLEDQTAGGTLYTLSSHLSDNEQSFMGIDPSNVGNTFIVVYADSPNTLHVIFENPILDSQLTADNFNIYKNNDVSDSAAILNLEFIEGEAYQHARITLGENAIGVAPFRIASPLMDNEKSIAGHVESFAKLDSIRMTDSSTIKMEFDREMNGDEILKLANYRISDSTNLETFNETGLVTGLGRTLADNFTGDGCKVIKDAVDANIYYICFSEPVAQEDPSSFRLQIDMSVRGIDGKPFQYSVGNVGVFDKNTVAKAAVAMISAYQMTNTYDVSLRFTQTINVDDLDPRAIKIYDHVYAGETLEDKLVAQGNRIIGFDDNGDLIIGLELVKPVGEIKQYNLELTEGCLIYDLGRIGRVPTMGEDGYRGFTLSMQRVESQNVTGDFNGDNVVSQGEFDLLKAKYGTESADDGFEAIFDLNADGIIDLFDLVISRKKLN